MGIDNKFRKKTLFLKKMLLSIKKSCDTQDSLLSEEEKIAFVKELKSEYYPFIIKVFIELTELSANFDDKAFEFHKRFIREHLYLLMADSSTQLNRQIGEKPLGYAGDYVVADYFYKDGYPGTSLFGMFMDRYTLETPLARAHINRRVYLGRTIEKFANRKIGDRLYVASFACGPAPEVFDTFDKGNKNIQFTLLDGEQGVISLLKNNLSRYPEQRKNVQMYHVNIIQLLRKNQKLDIPSQDIIYCAGFFDYIREATAVKCIRYFLNYLKSGGLLIITNVSMDDVKNVYLKMLGGWELYHRSKRELLSLVDNVEGIRQKKVVADYHTKRNLYLVLKKA